MSGNIYALTFLYAVHKTCKLLEIVDFFSLNTFLGSLEDLKFISNLSLLAKILEGLTLPLLKNTAV